MGLFLRVRATLCLYTRTVLLIPLQINEKFWALNLEFFIARHILSGRKNSFSRPIVRIAIISIALSIAVMIISIAIVTGFQTEIRDKVIGFSAHIQISNFDANNSYESTPVSMKQPFYPSLQDEPGVKHIQVFAIKAGIIKTAQDIEGVVLKGVGSDFDWSFFRDKIVEGKHFTVTDTGKTSDVIISRNEASRLKLKVGDDMLMYFINESQSQPSVRKFRISGIYDTGLEEFDRTYVFGDIHHIQKLNKWDSTQVGGFEVLINDFDQLDEVTARVYHSIGYNLNARSIRETNPQIFDWLSFQDVNVAIIIIMMVFVAIISVMSTLLIIIIEKTSMIGILKSLGTTNWSIRKVFLYNVVYLVGNGMLWGNLFALLLCFLQLHFGIFRLDPASYYVNTVPVNINGFHILLVNAGTLVVCFLVLIIPTYIVTRISPVRAIRME
jgi:lipoprotein-releasing system permease protein